MRMKKDNFLEKIKQLGEMADKVGDFDDVVQDVLKSYEAVLDAETLLIPRIIMEVMGSTMHSWAEKMVILAGIENYLIHGDEYFISYEQIMTKTGVSESEIEGCFISEQWQVKCLHPNGKYKYGGNCDCAIFNSQGLFCRKVTSKNGTRGVKFSKYYISENFECLEENRNEGCED